MKRRLLSIFLSLTMILSMVPSVWAADETGETQQDTEAQETETPAKSATFGDCGATDADTVKWALTKNTDESTYTLTISGEGNMADFTQPTKPDAENVNIAPWYTTLTADETTNLVPITEIKIEEGVTYLGNWAFSCLTNVVKVNIPASITELGNHIFRGDTALTTVEWASGFNAPEIIDTDSNSAPYTGNYVPTSMFDGCTSLGSGEELSAWLPASFTGVGCAAFRGTQFTVDFDDWNNLKYIGAYGFAGMPNLDSFTLSNEITLGLRGTSEASNAFNSSGLKSLTVEEGITAIPFGMCDGCEQLSSVDLADSVTTIAMNAFRNTKALKEIDLKKKVQTINGYAFQGSGLTELVLPESVKTVENRAFEACTSLTKVTINAADLMLENKNTFAGCSSLSTVVTSADSKIDGLNTGAFGPDTTVYAQAPVESIEINGTVDTLNFSALASLKNLTINGKNNLTSGALPSGFENLVINGDSWSVGHYQFQRGTHVKHLVVSANAVSAAVISDGATTKETEAAFRSNSNLETAQFTGTTVKLQAKMFMGCTGLNWLDLSAVDTLTVGSGCFGDDTNSTYGASTEKPNKFNEDCVIYAKDATAAKTLRSSLGTKGIVLIVNGGTVDVTAATAGFGAVSKSDCTAKWYEYNSTINDYSAEEPVTAPTSGKTYIVIWTACDHDTKAYTASGAGAVLTESCADCGHVFGTATVVAPTELTYSGSEKVATVTNSTGWTAAVPTPVYYSGSTQLKSAPINAGTYTAKITVGAVTASVKFTITKATPDIKISADQTSLTGSGTVKLTVTGAPAEGSVEVTCNNGITVIKNEDDTYSAVLPNATKTYTFKASYTGAENGNYSDKYAECTVTVTRHSSGSGSSYAVSAPSSVKNGTVTVSPKSASKGSTVTVTVKPDSGYVLETLTVVDQNGSKIKLTDKGDGKYTFTMPSGKVEVKAAFMEDNSVLNFFYDVPNDAYYYEAVKWAVDKGITGGVGDNLFGAEQTCTRGQIVTFLWRAAGSPEPKSASSFADVSADSYYAKAVAWAVENGITTGTGADQFSPDAVCTRAQAVTFLARALNGKAAGGAEFTDVPADSYFADAVAWALSNGVTGGIGDGLFGADNDCTRAQIVTFLFRAYNK